MSSIDDYVEKVKRETKGFSEDEIVRYVYMDLGQRLSFNVNYFLGGSNEKKQIYRESEKNVADEALTSNIIICRDSSNIIEIVLNRLGINVTTIVDEGEYGQKYEHIYNIVRPSDGRPSYKVDLQADLENIQAHMRTTHFGVAINDWQPDVITRDELERIDKKIGYITRDYYYADEYIDLLKTYGDYFKDFKERAGFILKNIDIYHNKKMGYAERVRHHLSMLKKLFTKDELVKIKQIDCYRDGEKGREYLPAITVSAPKRGTDIYMFSKENNQYDKTDYEDLIKQMDNGLVIMQIIPALKQFIKMKERAKKTDADGRG